MKFNKKGRHECSADELREYYNQSTSCGKMGLIFNTDVNEMIFRAYPNANRTETILDDGITLEVKQGCTWLISASYDTQEDALQAWERTARPIGGASHVVYIPHYDGTNLLDARVYDVDTFINIILTTGSWCITSSSGQWKRYGVKLRKIQGKIGKRFTDMLERNGVNLLDFLTRDEPEPEPEQTEGSDKEN